MYAEVAWVLVSSETQVKPQIMLEPNYLPDYLSVFYYYVIIKKIHVSCVSGECFDGLCWALYAYVCVSGG